MPRIDISEFDFTRRSIEKFADHGILPAQLYAVLGNFWTVTRNRKDRAASHVLLGTDNQRRCLAIPIVSTDDTYVWRPITAWYCKPGEAAILRKRSPS